ncbi:MAG: prepilin-type N-terminal cleavage/methylation domain-containing protein [Planctomycetota bacterium]
MTSPRYAKSRDTPQAFTLIELLVVVAVIALLIGLLLPALSKARQSARDALDLSNLRQVGTSAHSYAVDNSDRIHGFTWNTDDHASLDGIANPANDKEAAAMQAIQLIREHSDNTTFTVNIDSFIPYARYSHLTLAGYNDRTIPDPAFICPHDVDLLNASKDPTTPSTALDQELVAVDPSLPIRYPYASSYYFTVSAIDPAQSRDIKAGISFSPGASSVVSQRWVQDPSSPSRLLYINNRNPGSPTLNPKHAEVRSPSQKVMKYHQDVYHNGNRGPEYFFVPGQKQPLLFFDASARAYAPEDTNPGWNPRTPNSTTPTLIDNDRDDSNESFPGHYKWTRGGLKGIDVGGKEVRTGQSR